jgi:hypothetical protein
MSQLRHFEYSAASFELEKVDFATQSSLQFFKNATQLVSDPVYKNDLTTRLESLADGINLLTNRST